MFMGVRFYFEHVNFFGYLTSDSGQDAPHASSHEISLLLRNLDDRGVLEELFSSSLVGSRDWVGAVLGAVRVVLERHAGALQSTAFLTPDHVAGILSPLKPHFSGYDFYAVVCTAGVAGRSNKKAEKVFQRLARESGEHGLILLPVGFAGRQNIVDPFPALRVLADTPMPAPCVVYWTGKGDACVVPLDEALGFFEKEVQPALRVAPGNVGDLFRGRTEAARVKTILHMSDLHFGARQPDRRRRYLKSHLARILPNIDRAVVTGDLFDDPDADLLAQFLEFRDDLEAMTAKPLIVIPGNHDVRTKGNRFKGLGENYKQISAVGIRPVEVDDDLKTIFFCFNSCEEGDFARGAVSLDQRLHLASTYNRLVQKRPDIDSYLKIALVHHHPFAYAREPEPTTTYQWLVSLVFPNPDQFLEFENSTDFLEWCEARGVSLILHGHKHVPRVVDRSDAFLVVGCGSTTGVENAPMSYDILKLNPESGTWSVTFYHDEKGDGSGFRRQQVTVNV